MTSLNAKRASFALPTLERPERWLRFAAAGVCAVLLLSGAVSSAQTLPPVYFDAPMIFGTGYAYSVAVGDFNGDGKLDLAVANGVGVSVLLGNGDGAFQPAVTYAAGTYTESIAVGDFNGDGKLDLVVNQQPFQRRHRERAAGQWRRYLSGAADLRSGRKSLWGGGGGLQRRRQARPGRDKLR